jgi:hypothetical protein
MLSPSLAILSPSRVILSEAKDLLLRLLRVNSAKHPRILLKERNAETPLPPRFDRRSRFDFAHRP